MIVIIAAAGAAIGVLKIVLMVFCALIALGVVVIIHELGHFITARKAGVEVEAFSIGFGPRLWGVKKGGIDYRISLIPFGGYVKMKGMEAEDGKEPHEIEGGFFAARPARRSFIAFAGPAMNILLALAVFTLLWLTGTKVPQGVLTTTIGYVEEDSPAGKAGLVPGDTILKVNGQPVKEWKDVMGGVAFSPTNRPIDLSIEHRGAIVSKRVFVEQDKEAGFRHLRIYPRMDLVVSEVEEGKDYLGQDFLAKELGLRKGDTLCSLAGENLYHIDQFREILRKNSGKEVELLVDRGTKKPRELTFPFRVPPAGIGVKLVTKGSLAKKIGLRNGDLIAEAAGEKISKVSAFEEILKKNAGKKIKLKVLPGKHLSAAGSSEETRKDNLLGATLEEGFPVLGFAPGVVYRMRKEGPFFATYSAIKNVVLTLKGLMTRRVSTKGISGPVGIVGFIAKSISISFTTFLYFIGFLSANFAVINLLPIPIVDGGHIMFCALEKVRRKPIRQKTMTVIVNVFFVLILAFFLFVTRNDVLRFLKGRPEKVQRKETEELWLEVPESGASLSTADCGLQIADCGGGNAGRLL